MKISVTVEVPDGDSCRDDGWLCQFYYPGDDHARDIREDWCDCFDREVKAYVKLAACRGAEVAPTSENWKAIMPGYEDE